MGVKTHEDGKQEEETKKLMIDNTGSQQLRQDVSSGQVDKNGKDRISTRPIYWPKITQSKRKGVRKARRHENTCFLLSLVDNEEYGELEVSLTDLATTQSAFEKLFENEESMEVWNEFVNRSGEEQDRYLRDMTAECIPEEETITNEQDEVPESHEENGYEIIMDKRAEHPAALNPDECFLRINPKNRTMLRRRHIPKGYIELHEEELVTWFTDDPTSVFVSMIPSSYDRLLLHSVCQYLDLHSSSFDSDGRRQTRVENYHETFDPPPMLLSKYLDSKTSS